MPDPGPAISPEQQRQLDRLLSGLEADPLAPTTVRARAQAADIHVADSLVGLEVQALRDADAIADLGSGSGFPGLALAVGLPQASVHLVESQQRRCEYLERMRVAAGLENVDVVCARAEQWSQGLGRMGAVVARALAPAPVVLEYAAPLLRRGGVLVDWRGRRDEQQEEQALRAARELGLELIEVRPVTPFDGSLDRHLHLYRKIAPTPPRYPRRAGMARKRPLG